MSLIQLIAIRIKAFRARAGLTQLEMSEVTGFSFKFYQQLESGKKKQIWLETVERLASAHGLEAWELIGSQEPAPKQKLKVPSSNVHQPRKSKAKRN